MVIGRLDLMCTCGGVEVKDPVDMVSDQRSVCSQSIFRCQLFKRENQSFIYACTP